MKKAEACMECGAIEGLVSIIACGQFRGSGRKVVLCNACMAAAASPARLVVQTARKRAGGGKERPGHG